MSILSTRATAELLDVPEGTLRHWRYMDRGPKSFRVGKHVKYRQSDVEAWLDQQVGATARGG